MELFEDDIFNSFLFQNKEYDVEPEIIVPKPVVPEPEVPPVPIDWDGIFGTIWIIIKAMISTVTISSTALDILINTVGFTTAMIWHIVRVGTPHADRDFELPNNGQG
jgi:hypothetical protein